MKNIKHILFLALLFSSSLFVSAQQIANLEGINYQAVAIDDEGKEIVGVDINGEPLFEREIGVRFTITAGVDGAVYYQDTHTTTTDKYGLFSLVIGKGTVTDGTNLMDIAWINGDQWLKVEISIHNDGNYKIVSNQQFMAVPYSFYTDDIADDAITTAKILNEEILSEDINNETILAEDINTGAVETSEILDETILSEDISNGTIINEDIADGTIDLTAKVTGILPVDNGGTGIDGSVVTDGQLLIGDGTSGDFQAANITAGTGIDITNTAGGIEISSPPVGVGSDGTFTIPVGSNGDINAGDAWYSPNSLKVTPSPDKPFVMGDIFLVSANKNLKGCILSAYLESIDGSGDANVQIVIFNPIGNGNVTLETPMTFKFLLVK